MRDEENEERTRGGGENSNSMREKEEEKRDEDEMKERKIVEGKMAKLRGTNKGPMMCFCCVFN